MNFTINKMELFQAMKSMIKVVPISSHLKELEGFLIESDDDNGEIILTATNMETAIQKKLKASVGASGSFVINAKVILNIALLMPNDKISFTLQDNGTVVITGAECTYVISVLSAKSYPKPEIPFPDDTINVSGICDLYAKTISSVSDNKEKISLCGVHIEIFSDCIQAAGCDGLRIAVTKHKAQTGGKISVTIPKNSLYHLSCAVNNEDVLEVGFCNNLLVFMMNGMLFSTRLIHERFIDTDKVFSCIKSCYIAKVDSKKLADAVNSIETMAKNSDDYQEQKINMRFENGEIKLSFKSNNTAGYIPVEAIISEPTPKGGFWYNTFHFADCFKTVDGEIELHMDSKGLIVIKSANSQYMMNSVLPTKAVKKPKSKTA